MLLIRKSIIEPYYVWFNRSPKLNHWKKLEKSQYFSENKLREIQSMLLNAMLSFVWTNNEYYRTTYQECGISLIKNPDERDIIRLPVLTKTEIRANTSRLISQGYNINQLQKAKTGGSTGKALELYFTEECSELRNACARRHDRWTGWEPGEPIAACWGNPRLPETWKQKLKQWLLQPIIYLDTMSVNESSVRAFVKQWQRVKPTLLFGHAHSIYILARYLRDMNIDTLRPKGILSSSMMLIPSERKFIEQVFGLKVIDRYGCEEVGLIACECDKHEGMHLNIEHLFIEFLRDDGSPCAPGEPGKIVITDLMNLAMPLIRYQVEDVGVPSSHICSCGRGLPLMESVAGRVADFLVKRDGTKVAGVSLIENTLTKFPGLDQMQLIQEDVGLIRVLIVPGQTFSDNTLMDLEGYFQKIFGRNTEISIEKTHGIKPESSGKYRFAICKVQDL